MAETQKGTETKTGQAGGAKVPVQAEQARGQQEAGTEGGQLTSRERFLPSIFGGIERPLSPFGAMRRMMEDMERLFEDVGAGRGWLDRLERGILPRGIGGGIWSPQVEVLEREGQLVVRADLPGLKAEDVKVEVVNNNLVLEGERKYEHEEQRRGIWRSERSYGSFYRTIPLPEGLDVESASASFENGVLEVSLKLPEKQQGKRIEVKGGVQGGQKKLH